MLFVLTLLVNGVARLLVVGSRARPPARRASRTQARPPTAAQLHGERGGGRMSAPASRRPLGALRGQPGAPAQDRSRAGRSSPRTVLALIPLVLIVYYLLQQGARRRGAASFFTTDPTGNTFFKSSSIGGIKSAILGTIEIVALASAIAVPIGVGVAVWLVEYGTNSWFANIVRFFVDVLTGVPSIVFGLFIYIVLIVGTGSSYAGYKGSLALSLLMLPVVIRSAEVILLLVPGGAARIGARARRAALEGDLPDRAADRAAGDGHRRAAGDRARRRRDRAAAVHGRLDERTTNFNLGGFMNSLPVQIYNDVTSPTTAVVDRAWGAALTLVTMILLLNLIARLISRRSRLA